MKRKIVLTLLLASICTLSACGKDDVGSAEMSVNQGNVSDNAENISDDNAQTNAQNGYVVTAVPTEAVPAESEIAEIPVAPETSLEVPAPETPVEETPAEISPEQSPEDISVNPETSAENISNPSVIDYTPSTAQAGTPASTAVLPANAPTPDDYNYGAAPMVYDIPGIKYIDNVLIANKSYSLPADFYPELNPTCLNQFYKLQNDASYEGLNIYLSSGFRSYETQDYIYNDYVAKDGQEKADTYSARPGHSEHQSGLAIDVNQIDDTFIGTPEAIWLEEHCWEYGFILRYPQSKQDITGYKYESWHIRYVGTDMSYKIHNKALEMNDPYLTLEEYFGIDSYYH
ncbi:MAG: D-alanyl-D-alanine carboxypeptidase family protein [Ruminococcus sp.]|nr:D-alanyl-D-alanine carboxypeptidase family protein [Ruminococcus sp.]